jgi:hypothetical protein
MFLSAFCGVDPSLVEEDDAEVNVVVGSGAAPAADARIEDPRGDDKGSSLKEVSDHGGTDAEAGRGIAALMLVARDAGRVGDPDDIVFVFVFVFDAECSFSSLSDVKEFRSWSWSWS